MMGIHDPLTRLCRRTALLGVGVPAIGLLLAGGPVQAETRGYMISVAHTATYSNEGNCPGGGNGGIVEIHKRVLVQRFGYSEAEALRILGNDGMDDAGQKVDLRRRGRLNDIAVDVANFPTSVPDPEIETVQGEYAYGFNLDGRVQPGSFIDPETGDKGVDNQMWRVLGCFEVYDVRRPIVPYNEGIAWDTAMDAMPAWLISISGDNLDKDGDVTVTFDRSLNVAMRDAKGAALAGASYTIDPDPRSHSEFKGRIENGVVTIEPGRPFFMQGESQFYAVLRFANTHLRLEMHPDGTLSGFIGGYQPWMDYYYYLAIRGEGTGQVNLPGVYYAMKRFADADPDPETGQNRAISATYYLEAVPAFHTDVDALTVAAAWEGADVNEQASAAGQQLAVVEQ